MGKELGFELYLITEGILREGSDNAEFFKKITAALKGGAGAIQLREKALGGSSLLKVALHLRELTLSYGAKLFINDRVDVALLSGSDGVHLPSSGLNAKEVRGLADSMGEKLLIGVSTHTLKEAREAERSGADFITFGPIFQTSTKARYGEPVGVKKLAEAAGSLEIPVFALGGVNKDNLRDVTAKGVRGAAMISAILGAEDVKESTQMIIDELGK